MTVNFRFNNGGTDVDFDDVFIRRDIFAQGNLWIWGANDGGQLGNNTNGNSLSSPVQTISGGLNWKQVSCGDHGVLFPGYTNAGIKTDGSLWLWGAGGDGQLGNNAQTNRSSPVQTVSGGSNWQQVSCGNRHTGAIKTDGTLWLWGRNSSGQLGTNNITNRSSPVQTIAGGANWKLVSCGNYYSAAIKTDGTLWLWGFNSSGQLGNNDPTFNNYSSPIQTVSQGTNWQQVSCGYNHAAAIKTDGSLWLWGNNDYGQLGTNNITNRSSPVQTIAGGANWKLVSCGNYYSAAIKTDGTLWLWGFNSSGQLGNNAQGDRSSPVQTVSGGTNWKLVSCGGYTAAAIKTDGTLWLWGNNYYGQLGTNAQGRRSSPVQTVSGGTNWKLVGAGISNIAAITDLDVYQY